MKKLDLSNIVTGVRRLGAVKATFEHIIEAMMEPLADLIYGLLAGSNSPTTLYGCVNSGSGSDYDISAGSIYYNGEVYTVAAFAGTAGGGQVPVLSIVTTYRVGDPVIYSDGNTFNTHSIRTMSWSFGASGSGIVDFAGLQTLKNRINVNLLDVPGQIAAIVDSAPGALDTLNELAAALGDDANFATTVTNSIALKVAKAGDSMTGALVNSSTGEFQGGVRTQNSGVYLKKKVVEIGDWNMNDLVTTISVAHGIADFTKIRAISGVIRNDAGTRMFPIHGVAIGPSDATDDKADLFFPTNVAGPVGPISSTHIYVMCRENSTFHTDADFNATSYNRGWITIDYEA